MIRSCWWLSGVLALASPLHADHTRILVDGNRLATLPVDARFLLPDGTMLTYQRLVEACSHLQISGLLHFEPASGRCRPVVQGTFPDWPDQAMPEDGITVVNLHNREMCHPGHCQVAVAGTAGNPGDGPGQFPVLIDAFSATPDSLDEEAAVTLAWQSIHATSCTLADDRGAPAEPVPKSGTAERIVSVTTRFFLECENDLSAVSAEVTVKVASDQVDPVFGDRFEQGVDESVGLDDPA